MCYARKSVLRKKAAQYSNLMTATDGKHEPKKTAYANAYAKTKAIMCKLFRTRGKGEHAPAV